MKNKKLRWATKKDIKTLKTCKEKSYGDVVYIKPLKQSVGRPFKKKYLTLDVPPDFFPIDVSFDGGKTWKSLLKVSKKEYRELFPYGFPTAKKKKNNKRIKHE